MENTTKKFMQLLNQVAERWAKKYNYELESKEKWSPADEPNPMNQILNTILEEVRYKDKNSDTCILTEQRFGNPRISIYSPNRKGFVALEFTKEGKISECLIFNEEGFKMMPKLKKEIEDLFEQAIKEE